MYINNNTNFHFRFFPEKLMTKRFKKSEKSYFGAILGSFCPNLEKNEFSSKKGFRQFLNIPIIYRGAKNLKKVTTHFW